MTFTTRREISDCDHPHTRETHIRFLQSFLPPTRTLAALITITKSPCPRCVDGLALPQKIGGLYRDVTEVLVGSIDDPPVAVDLVTLG